MNAPKQYLVEHLGEKTTKRDIRDLEFLNELCNGSVEPVKVKALTARK